MKSGSESERIFSLTSLVLTQITSSLIIQDRGKFKFPPRFQLHS